MQLNKKPSGWSAFIYYEPWYLNELVSNATDPKTILIYETNKDWWIQVITEQIIMIDSSTE